METSHPRSHEPGHILLGGLCLIWLVLVNSLAYGQAHRGESEGSVDLSHLEMAASNGDSRAADQLGEWYLSELNFQVARNWFERGAKGGEPNSQWRLGEILKKGTPAIEGRSRELPAQPAAAIRWLFRAARLGHGPAMLELGQCYEKGIGVPVDKVEAYKWYDLASQKNAPQAEVFRESLHAQITSDQRTEGKERASRFAEGKEKWPSGLAEIPVLDQIFLRGISGPKERRLALINTHSFSKGEEREVTINEKPVKVRCLDIREQSVIIRIEGVTEAKELYLSR